MFIKSLGILLFVPSLVLAVNWSSINSRAVSGIDPSGKFNKNKVITMPGDSKLLGLDSNAKSFLQSRSLKSPSHVKGLNADFASRLAKFIKGAEAAGYRIKIKSGYRSPAYQAVLYKRALARHGSSARKWVAPPGRSNHGRGIAADLSYSPKTAAKNWAHRNASKYGLRFRMSWEPWHIEPFGRVKPGGEGQGDTSGSGQNKFSDIIKGQGAQQGQGGQQPKPQVKQPASQSQQPKSKQRYQRPNSVRVLDVARGAAKLTCLPTKNTTGYIIVAWDCTGGATRSRVGTTKQGSIVKTKGSTTGEQTVTITQPTMYKLQCIAGDRLIAEDVCKVSPTKGSLGIANILSNLLGSNNRTARNLKRPTKSDRVVMSLTLDTPDVDYGSSTYLTWATLGVKNCSVKGGNIEEYGNGGSVPTGSLYHKTIYILECETPQGTKVLKREVGVR